MCFSHTHSGPVVGKNLEPLHYRLLTAEQRQRVDEYSETLQQRILDCVQQALDDLQPCGLVWGSGTATFAVNRRNNPEDKVPELRAANQLQGPCDHDVPVLAARKPDGSWKAVVMGYACHSTVLDHYFWCGDYPGFATVDLETRHPGCTALFWAGCGADQNPLPRRTLVLAQQYGAQLAQAVAGVLSDGARCSRFPPRCERRTGRSSCRSTRSRRRNSSSRPQNLTDRYQRARAEMQLERLAAGQALPTMYPYPVQTWLLGDQVQLVFLGGEVVVDYALRLKTELRGKQTWVAGYANDVMAYIPSRRVLGGGRYEGRDAMVYYGICGVWNPQVEQLIVDAVHAQLVSSQ